MCGIVGYVGQNNAAKAVLDGLELLEYRGYDSSGIALCRDKLELYKDCLRVRALRNLVPDGGCALAIGHTRWATHGMPSRKNAHPHISFDEKVAICHNGIIENYRELKRELQLKGIDFYSDTDSEVIAHLVALELKDSKTLTEALIKATNYLKGAFTILAISPLFPGEIAAYRYNASLLVSKTKDGGIAASDALALYKYTDEAYILQNNEAARITANSIEIFSNGIKIEKTPVRIEKYTLSERECHMDSEILEIPCALKKTYVSVSKTLKGINLDGIDSVVLSGCGTAFHAALYGKRVIEKLARIPCSTYIASEFSEASFINEKTLAIFLSQSGETKDTLTALETAKSFGAKTLAITNVKGSTLDYASDYTLLLKAGPEIAVAATKSYNTMLLTLYLLAEHMSKKAIDKSGLFALFEETAALSFDRKFGFPPINGICFFIGKGVDYITAREGALKFKEITYKPTDVQPAGELKHGTIALVDGSSLVVAVLTDEREKAKTVSAIHELKSRGAYIIVITSLDDIQADEVIKIKNIDPLLSPILAVIPLQRLALYVSKALGLDPDKPRNLAKSVTVD